VSVCYVELADYLAIAAEITGLDTTTLIRVTKVDLAESGLHVPAAGFGETEFYPDFIDNLDRRLRSPVVSLEATRPSGAASRLSRCCASPGPQAPRPRPLRA